jgi:prepilin-type N-terminal cleavage/methylation domain-containing protein
MTSPRTQSRTDAGFTLIELMIVVAIIAVLAGILIPNFVHARGQSATAACEANLRSIATAAELYFTDNQVYPATTQAVDTTFGTTGTAGTYLNNTPIDPAAATSALRYTFTNDGQVSAPHYTITCPANHDPNSLTKVNAGTAVTTATSLKYTSDSGLGLGAVVGGN